MGSDGHSSEEQLAKHEGPVGQVLGDGSVRFLTRVGGWLLDMWRAHLLLGNTQEHSGMLPDT